MGARFNWISHFGQAPRYAKDMKVIQLDIAPEEIGHNNATEVALVGDGEAIVGRLAAIRHLFDWLVTGQVVPVNPRIYVIKRITKNLRNHRGS
jgi:thiamine pyrophosphate-dependent acetolactate synthase large subunit-like protein